MAHDKFGPYVLIPSRLKASSPEEIEWYVKQRELQKHFLNTIRAGDLVEYSRPGARKKYYGLVLETRVDPVLNRGDAPALKQLRIQWSTELEESDEMNTDEQHWYNIWSYDYWTVMNR